MKLIESDGTYIAPAHGWTCFHCGETFHAVGLAAAHFGRLVDGEPACRLNQKERGLAFQLHEAQEQLERYRDEDSDTDRAMHAMKAAHTQALIREEEKGYAKGLADARRDVKETLRAVLYFFGPEGAKKVTDHALEARARCELSGGR